MSDPILLYDGDCGLCARAIEWIEARARPRPLAAHAWQSLASLPPGVDVARLEREMIVVDGARISGGFDAFVALAPCVPALRPLAWLARLPGARRLGRAVYRLVARHRRAISARLGLRACALPRRIER